MTLTFVLRSMRILAWLALTGTQALAQPAMNLAQARRGLEAPAVPARLAAVERLGELGTMADSPRLMPRLSDADENVRDAATTSIWQIWGRSGDPAVDALMARGLERMRSVRLEEALAVFDEVVRRKPEFAEGWNKRAAVKQLLGRHASALRDAAEALQRNPAHFGALASAGHSHLALGDRPRALAAFRGALTLNPHLGAVAQAVRELEPRPGPQRRGGGS